MKIIIIVAVLFIAVIALVGSERLPNINSDTNDWGTILNAFLNVSHFENGTLKINDSYLQIGNMSHIGNVTDNNQLANGAGYITTDTDTRATTEQIYGNFTNTTHINITLTAEGIQINLSVTQKLCVQLTGNADLCDGNDATGSGFTEGESLSALNANVTGMFNVSGEAFYMGSEIATLADLTGGNVTVSSIFRVQNKQGVSVPPLTAMHFSGWNVGQNAPEVQYALSTDKLKHAECITSETIANNGFGSCVAHGIINNVDTSSYTEDIVLHLNKTDGTMTKLQPVKVECIQELGESQRSHATLGVFYANIPPGCEEVPSTVNVTGNLSVGMSSFFVDETNNFVGIGIFNPVYSLHVIGNINITGSFNATRIEGNIILQNGNQVNHSLFDLSQFNDDLIHTVDTHSDSTDWINNATDWLGVPNSSILRVGNLSDISWYINQTINLSLYSTGTHTVQSDTTDWLNNLTANPHSSESDFQYNFSVNLTQPQGLVIQNLTVRDDNISIGSMSIAEFNSSCSGFRFGITGGWILSCV